MTTQAITWATANGKKLVMPDRHSSVIPVRRRPWQPVIVIAVVQINVIVVDLERSRGFYERLGMEFRPRNRRGEGPAEAWVSTNTGATVVLHSPGFASWWDETAPQPSVGGPQVDLELESVQRLDEVIAGLDAVGATIIKRPTDMPWGQRFAIVLDPDGNRIGLKVPQV